LNIHAIGIFDANILERRIMSLMTKPRETRGLLRIGFAAVCVVVGLATCGSALALRLEVNEPPPSATASTTMPAPKGPVRVSGGIAAGSKIGGENPKYPADARKAHVEGTVALRAIIGKTGAITNLQVISGPEELRQSAMDAVRTWQYKPYLLNGEPTAVETTINVNYSLGG
jgi:TonB family protein